MANTTYTVEELERQRQTLMDNINEREGKIFNGDMEISDCFVSRSLDAVALQVIDAQIDIIKNGGTRQTVAFVDLDGNPMDVSDWFTNKFGSLSRKFTFKDKRSFYSSAQTEKGMQKLMEKHGFKMLPATETVWAKLKGGKTLGDAYVLIYPSYNHVTGEPYELKIC